MTFCFEISFNTLKNKATLKNFLNLEGFIQCETVGFFLFILILQNHWQTTKLFFSESFHSSGFHEEWILYLENKRCVSY